MNCIYCGHETSNDVDHFHGSVSKVCKYTNCKSKLQNFKIRLKKHKKSNYQTVKEFAYIAEKKVFEENEPAIAWNNQLMVIIKHKSKSDIQKPFIS